jgi:iron complex outermembrane receptor protein
MKGVRRVRWLSVWMVAIWPVVASAQNPAALAASQAQDLKRLTIEELAEIDVTTASRRTERLAQIAAAVSVIRQEDIRRAGVTTLAAAMRLADSVDAAQVYGPGWAITTRGFDISTANKMLVLIDGRTVYSPLFSGVFWEVQDLVLADIDRIEVIRGPGGALWGANAVNGVINVITKRAADTRGLMVDVGAGNDTVGKATIRYGGGLGQGSYRVYAKFRSADEHRFATGAPGNDPFSIGQSGFRMESIPDAQSSWFVQGDLYYATQGLYDRPATRLSGGNVLSRWTRRFSTSSQFQAQAYYDRTYRRVQRQYKATRDTVDIDLQQQLILGARHELVFGTGFRVSRGDDLGDGPGFFFDPQVRTSALGNFFAQDQIALSMNRLFLTVGSKVERNDFTGFEVQPTARLRWTPDNRQTLWTALSRAVRMPTRFDTDLRIVIPGTSILFLTGSENFESEDVVAYEGGYRVRPSAWVSFDVAAYVNDYNNLRSQEPPAAPGAPIVLANGLNARTSGVEIAATVDLATWWQTHASFSRLTGKFSKDPASRDTTNGSSEANDPSSLFFVRSYLDLPRQFEFDTFVRYVGRRPRPLVPAYTELNLRLGWAVRPNWDVSLVAENLLHDRHTEFAAGTPLEQFERAAYIRSQWHF